MTSNLQCMTKPSPNSLFNWAINQAAFLSPPIYLTLSGSGLQETAFSNTKVYRYFRHNQSPPLFLECIPKLLTLLLPRNKVSDDSLSLNINTFSTKGIDAVLITGHTLCSMFMPSHAGMALPNISKPGVSEVFLHPEDSSP